jgi:hypothetical protein
MPYLSILFNVLYYFYYPHDGTRTPLMMMLLLISSGVARSFVELVS